MAFACPLCDSAHALLIEVAPGMPLQLWWVTGMVLFILALAATIDAFTACVPDILVLGGLLAVTGLLGLFGSWPVADAHLQAAVAAGLIIWAVNLVWYCASGHDALGMGDAKWTMLAVACFGAFSGLLAWGVGACLAAGWIALARLGRYQVTRVTFAPFLFFGLAAGLYWLRFYRA